MPVGLQHPETLNGKEVDQPPCKVVTSQSLDESRLINKPENSESSKDLLRTISEKCRFNSTFPAQSTRVKFTRQQGNRPMYTLNKFTATELFNRRYEDVDGEEQGAIE